MQINTRKDWTDYITFATHYTCEEITEELHSQWISSIQFLQQELGKGFLKNCDISHPMFLIIDNCSHGGVWAVETLISTAQTLQKIQNNTPSYSKLLGKLLSPNKCKTEGIPFIEVSKMYLTMGLSVRFLEESALQKRPDIEIHNPETDEIFYIEVSRLHDNDTVKESAISYHEFLGHLPILHDTPHSCYQVRNFRGEEIDKVIQTILATREQALVEDKLVYHKDGDIELAIAPHHRRNELDDFCTGKNMRVGVHGIPLNFNETRRISDYKLPVKCKQIPNGLSGMIYIPVNQIYLWVLDFQETVTAFQKQLQFYPNVLGIVVYGDTVNPEDSFSIEGDGYVYTNKMLNQGILRKMLFIKNTCYENSLKEETLALIYKTFQR